MAAKGERQLVRTWRSADAQKIFRVRYLHLNRGSDCIFPADHGEFVERYQCIAGNRRGFPTAFQAFSPRTLNFLFGLEPEVQ